ncbi:MAG: NAD(P)H-hydrate dehydratase [Dehalococcoidia bacterium]|nr:NAD(P)H-hydrate dehydratase [Dehalococcoidia bacterium]
MKLVTAAQMRALEEAAVRAGISEQALMERAGLAAAQEAWVLIGATEGRRVLVLVGPGRNGGDGLVAARHLAAWGAAAHAYLLQPRAAADQQWRALQEAEVPHTVIAEDGGLQQLERLLGEASCVIDALLGTGVSRPIDGDLARVLDRLRAAGERAGGSRVLALDLPSGLDPDSGVADPATVAAETTVAFGYAKVGTLSPAGRRLAGRVIALDIGLPPEEAAGLPFEQIDFRLAQSLMPPRPPDAHKGSFGRAVVAAGSRRFPGAARLAAEAAARSGAGLVVLAAPRSIQPLLVHGLPDVVHEPLPDADGALDAAGARAMLRALPGADALLVGPGLSLVPAVERFVDTLLAGLDAVAGLRAAVLDADALTVLSRRGGWHERLALARVLTPHPGEMARLTGSTVERVQADRLGVATGFARESGSVVVLKGAGTIVAAPDGRARLSGAANAMLATAGTGDVLAGLIVGLIAQGLDPYDAATAAVYLHAEAGVRVGEALGAASGLAQDLFQALPQVRRALDGG